MRSLLDILEKRFKANLHRHPGILWEDVLKRLNKNQDALKSIQMMEETLGEPDVVSIGNNNEIIYVDCSKETPKGRTSICYDEAALQARKSYKPRSSAEKMASEMGITMLDFEEYKKLQALEPVDLKTSSWLLTPNDIRKLGGALFGDRRFNHVFLYHNGADSYYGVRGFRGKIII